jgi:low affinity Fe/Cu permease
MSQTQRTWERTQTEGPGFFYRFATRASEIVSRAPFFAFCLLLVFVWLVEGILHVVSTGPDALLEDTYQLQINTTTIITFLLVALLQNSQTRSERALHHKLLPSRTALPTS